MTTKTSLLEVPFSGGMLRGTITERTPPTPSSAEEGAEYKTRTLVCVHGFEWPASIDQKFRTLAETLPQNGYRVIRFDYRGNGLSDGDFRDTRIATMLEDLTLVMNTISSNEKVDIASYSIGTCITTLYWKNHPERINKILYFGAAFDHASISRFVTLKRAVKSFLPFINVPWSWRMKAPVASIFKKPFHKTKFSHEISSEFYRDLLDTNVNDIVETIPQNQRAWVHGDQDPSAPMANVTAHFDQKLIVSGGDHHLEKTVFVEKWLPFVQNFLGL